MEISTIPWESEWLDIGGSRIYKWGLHGYFVYASEYPEVKNIRSSFGQREFMIQKWREKYHVAEGQELTHCICQEDEDLDSGECV